jgi:hypothetical protein
VVLEFGLFCLCSFHKTASVVYWSDFLATDPGAPVRFPALPKKKVVLSSIELVS